MLSQIIRFALPSHLTISSAEFSALRQKAAAAGATKQYYGYTVSVGFSPLPRRRHEICWVINWADRCNGTPVMADLENLVAGDTTSSLFLDFTTSQLEGLSKALEAPVCEFACIRLSDQAPLSDVHLKASMQKTFTDTFKLLGFTGGAWAYATNSNESSGTQSSVSSGRIAPGEQRLGIYCLGWESIELHEDASKTPIFAEELSKLMPYSSHGSGAWPDKAPR